MDKEKEKQTKERGVKKLDRYVTWKDYRISKKKLKSLQEMCMDKRYINKVMVAAMQTDPVIAKWLIKSVTQKKTYEQIEFDEKLGRIPIGRTDFYGKRRKFYSIFDKLRKERKNENY